ncbi:MAG: hypothetical protein RI560_01195 [Natronomonas sp.]|nr:hypothetical protein [Natronomonas sp.]MDR9380274.1 hypothetical protein [Natronomonas sp.]MDR9430643.1 hypothetical protein [Natronomonas sp.]
MDRLTDGVDKLQLLLVGDRIAPLADQFEFPEEGVAVGESLGRLRRQAYLVDDLRTVVGVCAREDFFFLRGAVKAFRQLLPLPVVVLDGDSALPKLLVNGDEASFMVSQQVDTLPALVGEVLDLLFGRLVGVKVVPDEPPERQKSGSEPVAVVAVHD